MLSKLSRTVGTVGTLSRNCRVLSNQGSTEGVQEAARRVVKGDLSPSTTTSSAGTELGHDEYTQYRFAIEAANRARSASA